MAVVENVPLARRCMPPQTLNQVIPPELYNAVAEVLVYLWSDGSEDSMRK